ncbi:GNAT family N-acetyltransferase [Brevundimonas faecalis]|uniref:GNAT family N-acetyltransferase n=1 Tax=Brevundimonas faecalis TaxID=947378 RepID=UPI0036096D74
MSLTLVRNDFESFFRTPFAVYPRDTPYVSPMRSDLKRYLDPRKNPLLKAGGALEALTVLRDGRPVARATAHRHPASNARHGLSRSYFGFLDAADDLEALALLFREVETFARRHGDTEVMGPFNLTAMQQVGLVTEGFEHAPFTDMVWSPPWLPARLEELGYSAEFPMSTFHFSPADVDRNRLLSPGAKAILESDDWTFAPIDRKRFKMRMEEARHCLNAGFDANPMFVPLTAEEFEFQAGEMMWVLDPALSSVIHYKGRPMGVVICIPDLNPFVKGAGATYGPRALWSWLKMRSRPKQAVIILYSVLPEAQGQGVNPAMLWRVVGALQQRGYVDCGGTWIADVNGASLRQLERIGGERLHRTHLFRKTLTEVEA